MTGAAGGLRLAEAMAVYAGRHRKILLLPKRVPVRYMAVANFAACLSGLMYLVAEENEAGKRIKLDPGDGLSGLLEMR